MDEWNKLDEVFPKLLHSQNPTFLSHFQNIGIDTQNVFFK